MGHGCTDEARISLVVAWDGLPFYATKCLQLLGRSRRFSLSVIGTEPSRPPVEIDHDLELQVSWVCREGSIDWRALGLMVPAMFCYSGWSNSQFRRLAREVKRSGGKTVMMADNCRRNDWRQLIGACVFKRRFLPHADFLFVPGEDGAELMRYFGVPDGRIHRGLYGADPEIFRPGPAHAERPIDFLFVGQFIDRKGIREIAQAVRELGRLSLRYRVVAVGAGPLRSILTESGIEAIPYASSDEIARYMRSARFLVLPSRSENWGVVVHEASLSGCGLILSDRVGSRRDLLCDANGFVFDAGCATSLAQTMATALSRGSAWSACCLATSLSLGARFGPCRFVRSLEAMAAQIAARVN